MKKVVFLPLDERPCNFSFPSFLCENNKNFQLVVPEKNILGNKKSPADFMHISNFLLDECKNADYLIISLDMLLYGGIVPSRLHFLESSELKLRLNVLNKIKENNPSIKIYAFSLIMRCPLYSSSDEEPDYYEICGKEIFLYGQNEHKHKLKLIKEKNYKHNKAFLGKICSPYLADFLGRRKKNISALKHSLTLYKNKVIDYFIIPQDDSAPYGYTALDQTIIKKFISKNGIAVDIYPGADEVGLTLLSRAVCDMEGGSPKICPVYPKEECKNVIPAFEDREVYKTIEFQIKNAGATICNEDDADIILFCNLPVGEMHNINNLGGESYDKRDIENFVLKMKKAFDSKKAVAFADIAYSNGGDVEICKLISNKYGLLRLAGYAGWNTSSNSLGTVICQSVFNHFYGNTKTHKKFTALRVYEDLGYCAYARLLMYTELLPPMGYSYSHADAMRGKVSELAKKLVTEFVKNNFSEIYEKFEIDDCYMPWVRMFEIGLTVKEKG